MPWRTAILGAVLLCGAAVASGASPEDASKQAARLAADVCSACHRPANKASEPLVPVLDGQHEAYLVWQMRAYHLAFRDDPQAHDKMWTPASGLEDAVVNALAAYYAALPPQPGVPGDAALVARGKSLYENGLASSSVADCSACHGARAEGEGMFPRLAGQRADYLVREISLIQLHLRNVGIMHSTVEGLSDDDIRALAAYLQSL
ncbi:MAG TPA: c-type cytochrome [Burkholderiales bacterium]|nr:c-type cytochrome [Burkholderiales bacterium]